MPHAQRFILVFSLVMAIGYAWLRGAFLFAAPAAAVLAPLPAGTGTATFAAGCFWSAEAAFEGMPGVLRVTAGYTGGTVAAPTYAQVSAGATGHAEAVEIRFDPRRVTYEQLLDRFWHQVDLFEAHRQFCDLGDQYRPEVFVHDAAQRAVAETTRSHWQRHFGRPVAVAISAAGAFHPAAAEHQDYASTHPWQYRFYRWSCGRDARLGEIWH